MSLATLVVQVKGVKFYDPGGLVNRAVSWRNMCDANCVEIFRSSHSGNSWWWLVLR